MANKKVYLVKNSDWHDREYLIKGFVDKDVAIEYVCKNILKHFTLTDEERLKMAKKYIIDLDCDFTTNKK